MRLSLSVNSAAQGDAGNIDISATEQVSFAGVGETEVPAFDDGMVISGASSQVQFEGNGNSGQVMIKAAELNLDTGAVFADHDGLEGNAGDIILEIENGISLNGGSLIDAQVGEDVEGNASSIEITASSYESKGGSKVLADNQGSGNGGNINFEIEETISLDEGSLIQTELGEDAVGNAGGIIINADSLMLNQGSDILSQTQGQGNAGEISITTQEDISLSNSQISGQVTSSAVGNGANISLKGGELNLTDSSRIIANIGDENSDAGSENFDPTNTAGDIRLDIDGDINLQNNSQIQSQVEADAGGDAGDIEIDTGGSLIFTGFNQILTDSQGNGNGGDIQITAGRSIQLEAGSLIFANTIGRSEGNAGTVIIEAADTISLNESLVLSQIQGEVEGNAGGINIAAKRIDVNNFSLVSTNAQEGTSGTAGNINLNGKNISISGGSVVDALTETNNNGGNIQIDGDNLAINSGGVVVTSTTSTGDAGNINLNLTDGLTINGKRTESRPESIFQLDEQVLKDLQESTGLFATSTIESQGSGGSIEVTNADNINISNNGKISVDSQGQGNGGSFTINADSLNLDNQAAISAITASNGGGNINLMVDDIVSLESNSTISAEALNQANGGNINIDTNFVIAFPNQNSDIVANAREGSGGNITITAESVLGIVERNSSPSNNTNDIDADSDFGLNGTVSIFTPSSDTFQRVTELKSDIVKPEQTTVPACRPGRQSTFSNYLTIKGKGGVNSAPDLPLDSQNILTNGQSSDLVSTIPAPIETSNGAIQPARGIKVNQDGSIVLTPYRTNNAGDRLFETNRNCGQV